LDPVRRTERLSLFRPEAKAQGDGKRARLQPGVHPAQHRGPSGPALAPTPARGRLARVSILRSGVSRETRPTPMKGSHSRLPFLSPHFGQFPFR